MKDLATKIKIMQAALDGKEIDRYVGPTYGWLGLDNPKEVNYDWTNQDYRIKPEPMEFWVNVYENRSGYLHRSKASAKDCLQSGSGKTIKVREVMEE